MDCIKIPIKQLKEEPSAFNCNLRYSHDGFTRRIPKGIIACDFDKKEKLIEVEFADGNRNWVDMEVLFGKVISKVKDLFILRENGDEERIDIVAVDNVKIKRTNYVKLIFETELPY